MIINVNQYLGNKVYNGTNHKVDLYRQDTSVYTKRSGSEWYVHANCTPTLLMSFEQGQRPLESRSVPFDVDGFRVNSVLSVNYPGGNDLLNPNNFSYDLILASSRYCKDLLAFFTSQNLLHDINVIDYLDRLYTLLPLRHEGNSAFTGCISFVKAFGALLPSAYFQLERVHVPSRCSALLSAHDYLKNHPAPNYNDINYQAAIQIINHYSPAAFAS